jgi:uncharacterized RDD family membrane protein YckC
VTNTVQCPQCGFLEFDEHSGCAVCGFHSRAALKTGPAALQPLDQRLVDFPHISREAGKLLSHHESALPEASLPLFDEPRRPRGTPVAPPELVWRKELQEKLRQYKARRGGPKKERSRDAGIAETGERIAPRGSSPSSDDDLAAALDKAFKLHPVVPPLAVEKEELETSFISARPRASGRTRRPELFQQPLLFEATTVARGPLAGTDLTGLPVPVASVHDRFLAASVDLVVIATVETISVLPILALLHAKGWSLTLAPRSVAIGLITFLIFALCYVFLFTATTGKTVGMHLRGLALVNFAGESPSVEETALRTVGYLVSAGSLLLGFIWVFFDVDALAWHDRISRTYPAHTRVLTPDS